MYTLKHQLYYINGIHTPIGSQTTRIVQLLAHHCTKSFAEFILFFSHNKEIIILTLVRTLELAKHELHNHVELRFTI